MTRYNARGTMQVSGQKSEQVRFDFGI